MTLKRVEKVVLGGWQRNILENVRDIISMTLVWTIIYNSWEMKILISEGSMDTIFASGLIKELT